MPDQTGLGALAAALAKAQAAFPAITRDKEVRVTSQRTGNSYTFKYAPLDKIIDKTRGPLSDNGLAVAQLLDSDAEGLPALVTMLLHSGGGALTARTPIPHPDGASAQEFGSAITYLRRYAYTAILGIATEDDDDGNAAAGNRAEFKGNRPPPEHLPPREGSLIGTAAIAAAPHDYELRVGPDGYSIGFKLVEGRQNIRVIAQGDLAEALSLIQEQVIGSRVVCYGKMSQETWEMDKGTPKARSVPYTRLILSRIETPTGVLPAPEEAPTVPMFDAETETELDAAVG